MKKSLILFFKAHHFTFLSSLFIFVTSFTIYASAVSHGLINQADSAELITAAYSLGMAHPPGYPLYILLLYFVMHIPSIANPFLTAHLTSAVLQSLNLVFFFLLGHSLIRQLYPKITSSITIFISLISTFTLAFSYFYFNQATFAEVFPLHLLFANLILLFTLSFPQHKFLLFFTLGVAFSHHQTIILLLPAILYFILKKSRHQPWLRFIALFLIGSTTPFLFGFVILSPNAPLSWQFNPTLSGLLELLSRSLYQPNGQPAYQQVPPIQLHFHSVIDLLSFIPKIYATIGTLFIGIGFFALLKYSRKLWIFFTLMLVCTGPLLAIYLRLNQLEPRNLEFFLYTLALSLRQFQLFFYLTALLMPVGIATVLKVSHRYSIHHRTPQIKFWILIIPSLIFISITIFSSNFRYLKNSNYEFDTKFSQSILQNLPPNSVLIVDNDYAFVLIGAQSINQVRPDILIVPTAMHMRWGYLQNILPPSIFRIAGLKELVLELTKWGIDQNQPVFIFDPRPELVSQLKVFGYHLTPHGYLHHITLSPIPDVSIDISGTSIPASSPTHPLDFWHQFTQLKIQNITTNLTSTPSSTPILP